MRIYLKEHDEDIKLTPLAAPDAATQLECVKFAINRIERAAEEAFRAEQNAMVSREACEQMYRRVADALREFGWQWGNVREIVRRLEESSTPATSHDEAKAAVGVRR